MITKIFLAISLTIHIYQFYDKYKPRTLTRQEEIELDNLDDLKLSFTHNQNRNH